MSAVVPWNAVQDLTFHYLPREICLLVQTNGPPDLGKAIAVNSDIIDKLNPGLRDVLQNVLPPGGDTYNQDISPSPILWQRCKIDKFGPLKELARWPAERQVVLMGDKGGDITQTLHFFAVDVNPIDPAFTEQERAGTIRELVNLINGRFRPYPDASNNPGWSILAATPNWLASPSNTDGGNPGTPPELVTHLPSNMLRFQFGHAGLDADVNAQRGRANEPSPVVVAVLDTSPLQADVTNAPNTFGGNPLIALVADPNIGVKIDEPLIRRFQAAIRFPALLQADFAHLADFVPNWGALLQAWQTATAANRPVLRNATYGTVDHGLFVSGIIKDIVTRAEVHLIRVLDSSGMGDLLTLTFALAALPDTLIPERDRRLIVNLSLGIDVPPPDDLRKFWFPRSANDPGHDAEKEAILNLIHSSFKAVIDWLTAQEILIVASTGNDSLGLVNPLPARYPAAYPGVVSAAALTRKGDRSAFSNTGTVTGVAVLGGDADINPATGDIEIKMNPMTGMPDAVVGIYESHTLPFGAGTNSIGWAYWAGTSFAAPVISAIAAVEYIIAPGANNLNNQLIATVQGFSMLNPLGLGVGGIIAFQT